MTLPFHSARVPADIWHRLCAWRAGPEGVAFVNRLGDKLRLNSGNASRLADEYVRFLALAVTGTGTTVPPRIIDAAWHLHQLDTCVWSDRFCPEVLGRTLMPGPARPPPWRDPGYAETRERYVEADGMSPPVDIWPDAMGHLCMRLFGWLVLLMVAVLGLWLITMIIGVKALASVVLACLFACVGAIALMSFRLPMRSGEGNDLSGGWWG